MKNLCTSCIYECNVFSGILRLLSYAPTPIYWEESGVTTLLVGIGAFDGGFGLLDIR